MVVLGFFDPKNSQNGNCRPEKEVCKIFPLMYSSPLMSFSREHCEVLKRASFQSPTKRLYITAV